MFDSDTWLLDWPVAAMKALCPVVSFAALNFATRVAAMSVVSAVVMNLAAAFAGDRRSPS